MNRKDSHRGLFFFASGIAALASQKNHMAVYLMSIYGDRTTLDWFVRAYAATGKRMDMGKSARDILWSQLRLGTYYQHIHREVYRRILLVACC